MDDPLDPLARDGSGQRRQGEGEERQGGRAL
jgi:hypothetical protein